MPLDVMYMLGVMGSLFTNYNLPRFLFIIIFGILLMELTARKGWAGYTLPGIASQQALEKIITNLTDPFKPVYVNDAVE